MLFSIANHYVPKVSPWLALGLRIAHNKNQRSCDPKTNAPSAANNNLWIIIFGGAAVRMRLEKSRSYAGGNEK
jgi:hypothetical protein